MEQNNDVYMPDVKQIEFSLRSLKNGLVSQQKTHYSTNLRRSPCLAKLASITIPS